jgi:nitrogen fixation/metabolism regulation signal transduction histidine kinase
MRHESRIHIFVLIAGFPGVLLSLWLLWTGAFSPKIQWTITVLILAFWFGFASAARNRVIQPLQTISNVLAALREGDFSIRVRGAGRGDSLDGVVVEVNALGTTLREQRLDAIDATALLRKVMEEIDVVVFTLDSNQVVRLVNRAGERMLARPAERIVGRSAAELGLANYLLGERLQMLETSFQGGAGRWELRRTSFWQGGQPHQLLVLTDLSRALREEERQAWKRLIRVLGHELNNSLTPIKSIASSLGGLMSRDPRPPDWEEDIRRGLAVIGSRGEALSRFMDAYARLAQLPPPRLQPLDVGTWVRRVVRLEARLDVILNPGPDLTIQADGDQLDQLLINLIRNGVEAALTTGGKVSVGWARTQSMADVWVDDEGPGLSNTANLFVPFFTTKPAGSGIGLVLSRQIAEAHGGSLILRNREGTTGCRALVRLPLR